jgi:hypothetical protein
MSIFYMSLIFSIQMEMVGQQPNSPHSLQVNQNVKPQWYIDKQGKDKVLR